MSRFFPLVASVYMSFFAHTSHAESYQAGLTSYLAKDYPLAVKQFQIAAEQGLAEAQFHLGNMHYMGLGTPKDFGQALRWYHLAAAQGNANALFKLGFMYDSGLGTPQDYLRSHMWLNLAGSRGSKTAIEYRDDIAKKMTPQQIGQAQKMARDCLARNFKRCD